MVIIKNKLKHCTIDGNTQINIINIRLIMRRKYQIAYFKNHTFDLKNHVLSSDKSDSSWHLTPAIFPASLRY